MINDIWLIHFTMVIADLQMIQNLQITIKLWMSELT